ncbi:MAG: AAA family ATPase [Bacteroidales bacterium]|nr:AAA family ATPase [Bacteroidales bacterium]
MIIIGITGTIGAGKGSIVDFLKEKKNFRHYSVRGFLIDEILKRGQKVDRDSMTDVANELRAKNSPSYIVDCLYEEAVKSGQNCVIESIRTPGEVLSLRSKENFNLFAVDCDPQIRFERIKTRASETDQVDYETFISNEKREMTTDDPNKQNLQKCIEMADYVFDNSGTIGELFDQVAKVIRDLGI